MIENSENSILKTEKLTIGYPQKKQDHIIFSNINLSIEKGKLISVLGKNGIGKSTLLRTLCKVQKPIAGAIYFEGKELNTYSENDLSKKLSVVLTVLGSLGMISDCL